MLRRAYLAAALTLGAGAAAAAGAMHEAQPASTRAWRALAPAPLERSEVAAARIGRHVYVVGGFERRSAASSAVLERYDIRTNRWRRLRSMPVQLNHAAAAASGGRLYVHGGYRRPLTGVAAGLLE
ncbi:MAG TPA: kelch repeat-containing protein, partial [Thermoleophilaceae bacterium]|nr:kelch repeat-containing protein [Thermoleophilaceae bacterium]